MTKKIILFNGPPGCGKDTAADIINKHYDTYAYKMALPLKEGAHKLLGLAGGLQDLEPIKELPVKFKTNTEKQLSLRQFYIHLSEFFLKPLMGGDVFGRIAVEYINQTDKNIVTISDCGFRDEIKPIIEAFGQENITLVRIHRPGKNFSSDSRSYIELPVFSIDINNDLTLEAFEDRLFYHLAGII